MRLEVAAWESGFLWRQTDDEHSTCVLRRFECSAEVFFCRHYVLGGCTDETSAHKAHNTRACKMLCGECWPVVATFVRSRLMEPVPQHGRLRQGFLQGRNGTGVGRNNPIFCCLCKAQRGAMPYRCVATSPEGLVQQVAVSYLRHGYWWYVTGRIPKGKDPETIDRKLVEKYGIDLTERQRAYRKQRGLANMQYLRHGDWFLLLATEGHHPFKQQERNQIRDCRRHPIKFEAYSISYRRSGITPAGGGQPKWHACVRIDPQTYKQLKAFFLDRACHRSVDNLAADFARVPFARYAPIRRQLLTIHRAVNDARSRMGYDPVPHSALRLRRQIVKPFSDQDQSVEMTAAA